MAEISRKIIVLGQALLPVELNETAEKRLSAPGIRAWHFARALREAGHEVALVSIHSANSPLLSARLLEPGLTLYQLNEADLTTSSALEKLVEDFKPDGAVAASAWPSYLAALFLPAELPFWGDLFGSPLAEGQAKAVTYQDDSLIEPFSRFERGVLDRADVVSTVSSYQEYATIGALATHGRLNRHTDGYRLVYTIPATLDPQRLPPAPQPVIRGTVVPGDAFVMLWSGGFNTWTDIETLFAGLEEAMQANPKLHFVSTGGALPPHDSQTYPRFEALVSASANRERYHLLGWLPLENLHNYYLESDLGIILDRWSYEGLLGSRTRLLDWLLYGLPAIITVTAELTEQLVEEHLAFSFPHGDSHALAELLKSLATQPAVLSEVRKRASAYAAQHFAYNQACRPLLKWAANPWQAPDAGKPRPQLAVNSGQATLELEKTLAGYRAQIEAKNAHIAELEQWAHDLEKRLQAQAGGWKNMLRKARP